MLPRVISHLRGSAVVAGFAGVLLFVRDAINSASAASVLLLAVVLAGRFWGMGPALTSSVLASVTLLYFFIPPVGFSVSDPNDWVSLMTFSVTGAVSGSLLARHQQVLQQRDHFERLYWTEYGKSTARMDASATPIDSED